MKSPDPSADGVTLDPALVRELDVLYRQLQTKARSGAAGGQVSPRRGGSFEFHGHREYLPGDDPRRVDWSAYARTGEPVIRTFRAEEDTLVRVLLDRSESMSFGSPTKLELGGKIAAALGYLAFKRADRAELFGTNEISAAELVPPKRGRTGVADLVRSALGAKARGKADLARAIGDIEKRSVRPGMLAVISDFFDSGPVERAISRVRSRGHDVVLVQTLAVEELAPSLEGELTIEDSETGETLDVFADPELLRQYSARMTEWIEALSLRARNLGVFHFVARTSDPIQEVMRRLVFKLRRT